MSTLLKAILLKTDNPFIMLKCYLEDILKADLSWDDLLNDMDKYKSGKDGVKIDPVLISSLKKLRDNHPELFQGGRLSTNQYDFTSRKDTPEGGSEPSDNTFDMTVRHTNLLGFRDSLKSSKLFQDDPSTLKPIMDKLNDLIVSVIPKSRPFPSPDKKRIKSLKVARTELNKLASKLKNVDFDFDGKLIYDIDTEDMIFSIVSSKEDLSTLRRLADTSPEEYKDSVAFEAQKDVYNLLNKQPFKINTIEGVKTGRFVDAIIEAYSQKNKVAIARLEEMGALKNRQEGVWTLLDTGERQKLEDLMRNPAQVDRSRTRREGRKQKKIEEASEQEEEERADSLIATLMREGSITLE
tara:strand:- start:24960 stop:26018 length:1059 start_codon:yes stop_codon:yes gene_type:complete